MSEEAMNPENNKASTYFLITSAILLIGILLFLLFGITGAPARTNTVEYNYFTFENVGGLWQTMLNIDNQLFLGVFRFNPKDVEDVYITGNFTGFKKLPIYITFDPDTEPEQFKYLALATTELGLHVIRALNFTIEAACTKNLTDACHNRAIVKCGDKDKSVIYLVAKQPTQITLDGSCITLSGESMELLRSTDRLLFQWYKVIQQFGTAMIE